MRFPADLRAQKQEERAETIGFGFAALRRYGTLAAIAMFPALLAGCSGTPGDFSGRAYQPLSAKMLALMQEKGTTENAPVLIRAFKKEAEVQVWKMKADGHYTLLKSYPICRWSGQLGPKKLEGDRQVPEGFYSIAPGQMNPRSNYYLSFNVGYPNVYDRAHGYTGGEIMVHGVCSSAGCFSMTNQQIAEIYAIAREALAGGQREIQMQSYPFHMTPENFAKYRLDPNSAFWKELRVGNDNFEVTKKEVAVGVCNEHYVFNAEPADGSAFDPTGPCPALKQDRDVALEVAAKEKSDDVKVATLVAEGVQPVRTVYADGGQNPLFAAQRLDASRPEALAEGPVNVPLDQGKKYRAPSLAQLQTAKVKAEAAAAAAEKKAAAAHAFAYVDPNELRQTAASQSWAPANAPTAEQATAVPPQTTPQTHSFGLGMPSFGRLLSAVAKPSPAPAPVQNTLAVPQPANAPLPPQRLASRSENAHALAPRSPIKLDHVKLEAKHDHLKLDQVKHRRAKAEPAKPHQAKAGGAKLARPASVEEKTVDGATPIIPSSFSAAATSFR